MDDFFSVTNLLLISFMMFCVVFIETWIAENKTNRGMYVFGQAGMLIVISVLLRFIFPLINPGFLFSTQYVALINIATVFFLLGIASAVATGCAISLNRAFVR